MKDQMRLIYDSWNRFLLKENEQQYPNFLNQRDKANLSFIEDYLFDKFEIADRKDRIQVLKEIEPLQHNIIVEFLGKGAFGVVYLLNNDHVLKIFYDDSESKGGKIDLEWYKNLQNKQFSGQSSTGSPMIYDYGNTAYGVKYVEMSKVIPLEMWLQMTNRNFGSDKMYAITWNIGGIVDVVRDLIQSNKDIMGDIDRLYDHLMYWLRWAKNYHPSRRFVYHWSNDSLKILNMVRSVLTDRELYSLLKAVIELLKTKPFEYTNDVHGGNIGVLITNPDVWVIFDS